MAATASPPIPARTGADPALGSCGVGFGSRVAVFCSRRCERNRGRAGGWDGRRECR